MRKAHEAVNSSISGSHKRERKQQLSKNPFVPAGEWLLCVRPAEYRLGNRMAAMLLINKIFVNASISSRSGWRQHAETTLSTLPTLSSAQCGPQMISGRQNKSTDRG